MVEQTIGNAFADAVARYGDRETFTFAERRMSLRDADVESDAVARALLGYGIGRGDRVAVWMVNYAPWVALYFGALKIGAVLVPLNTRAKAAEPSSISPSSRWRERSPSVNSSSAAPRSATMHSPPPSTPCSHAIQPW